MKPRKGSWKKTGVRTNRRAQPAPQATGTGKAGQKVRRGQLVVPFGVGAIVEVGQQSFVCADLSRWLAEETLPLDPSELERITGRQVRTPAASAPFVRFPRWLFCPTCRKMRHLTESAEREMLASGAASPRCASCKVELAPMGFVQACTDGHLDEIDWFRWAHRNAQTASTGQCARGSAELRFATSGARGGDWETLWIECDKCGAKNNLEGLTTRPMPWPCRGRQPWMDQDGPSCDKKPGGHRRGDSNLYFPHTLSAIDVLVDGAIASGGIRAFLEEQFISGVWKGMRGFFNTFPPAVMVERLQQQLSDLAAARGVSRSELEEALMAILENRPDASPAAPPGGASDQDTILSREWPVLSRSSPLDNPFLIIDPRKPGPEWPGDLAAAIQRISLVPRLREVRGLLGYRRVDSSEGAEVPLDVSNEKGWIPGVEVWGEGLFLQFSESYVAAWEASLSDRLQLRAKRLAERTEQIGRDPGRVTPRFLALHTLSHVLMRRLAFDAGYSSTSLRERVYAGEKMAGILIYTADGDSEGSLGGLVRMGEPSRILRTIIAALNDASWCSADPVCAETSSQGVNGMNGAACHACSLAAETSCIHGNQYLDRHFMLRAGDGRMDSGMLPLPPIQEG